VGVAEKMARIKVVAGPSPPKKGSHAKLGRPKRAISKHKSPSTTVDPQSNKRATGKRVRKQYDPQKWSRSILARRTNVLCLGMSYPCVSSQIEAADLSKNVQLENPSVSVEQAIELVRRNVLTQMDGRDLARCLALEAQNDTLAYTVSLETGALYSPRHLRANFNRKNCVREMKKAWGPGVKFRQLILDYFWIPRGTWAMTHWTRTFFNTTLPSFVEEGLIDFRELELIEDEDKSFPKSSSPDDSSTSTGTSQKSPKTLCTSGTGSGVVFLPFSLHCVREVLAAILVLSKYYSISFLYKSELAEHALWAATSSIDPDEMQSWLGKAIAQENEYCTFSPQEVKLSADDEYVRKEDLLKLLRRIENFSDVRMIRLKVLKKFDPDYVPAKNSSASESDEIGVTKGGFTGLVPEAEVQNGIDYLLKAKQLLTKQAQKEIGKKLIASKASIRPMIKKKSLVDKQSAKTGGKMASKVMDLTVAENGFGLIRMNQTKNLNANKTPKKARNREMLSKQVKKKKVGRPKNPVKCIHMVSPDGSESDGTDQEERIACRTDTGNVSQDDSLCDSDHVDSSIKSLLICHDGFPHTFCSKLCCTDVATLDLSEAMEVMKKEDIKTGSNEFDGLEVNQSLPECENKARAIPLDDKDQPLYSLKDFDAAMLLAGLSRRDECKINKKLTARAHSSESSHSPNANGPTSGPILPAFKEPSKIACPHSSDYLPSQELKHEHIENQMVPHYLAPNTPYTAPFSDQWASMNNQVWQGPYLSSGTLLTSSNQLEMGGGMQQGQSYQMHVQGEISIMQERIEALETLHTHIASNAALFCSSSGMANSFP